MGSAELADLDLRARRRAGPAPRRPARRSRSELWRAFVLVPAAAVLAIRADGSHHAAHGGRAVPPTPERAVHLVDGVQLEVFRVSPARAEALYRAAAGAPVARSGPPACAHGRPDERAWSRPSEPSRAVGRYRCRIEGGRAALWWTDSGGFVAHATAADGDLARLFAWWCGHSDHP